MRLVSRAPTCYPNKHPGPCEYCGQTVPAGAGRVRRDRYRTWYVSHPPAQKVGWPDVRWIGGCPTTPPATPPGDTP